MKQLDAKIALRIINDQINCCDPKDRKWWENHALELNELIMSEEVPMPEVDEEANRDWWESIHGDNQ